MAEPLKVLMIDDEQDFSEMVKENLEDTGEFTVVTLNDPLKAEEVVAAENPDLILLDNIMPKRKGADIVENLRGNPDTKAIMIIMVSGKGEMVYDKKKETYRWLPNTPLVKNRGEMPEAKGNEALAEVYAVDDYIAKPFATELLVEVIQEVIKRKKKKPQGDEKQPSPGL